MIDMSNIGKDFMPRKRPEEGLAPQAPPMGAGGQPFTPPQVSQAPPPGGEVQYGGGQQPFSQTQPFGGGLPQGERGTSMPDWLVSGQAPPGGLGDYSVGYGGVGTGQQPFTPVGGQPPGVAPPSGGGYRAIRLGEDPAAYQQEMAAGGTFVGGQPPGGGSGMGEQFQRATPWTQTYEAPAEVQAQYAPTPEQQAMTGTGGQLQRQSFAPGGQPGQIPAAPGGAGAGGTSVAPGGGEFPYPEQWQQAGDIYGQLAGGMPGMPDPGAIWGGYEQQAGDLSRELAEQAGMGMGSRYGSALQRNVADVGMRAGERFGGEMERLRMGDIQGQRQAMLGAAGGLSGLGGAQAMLPGQLSQQAMSLGGQYQGMQQQEYDRQRQEWMRQQPEYSPYLPYMQQGSQVQYGPQSYQPGFASNMMDIGGMMGMYGMMNQGGNPIQGNYPSASGIEEGFQNLPLR